MFRFVNPCLVLLVPTEFALRISQPSLTEYVKWCKKCWFIIESPQRTLSHNIEAK